VVFDFLKTHKAKNVAMTKISSLFFRGNKDSTSNALPIHAVSLVDQHLQLMKN